MAVGHQAACVLGALWLACLGTAPAEAAAPVHVLLVTVDTLRADRLGCYGRGPAASTPVIDALAARGVLFERAFAHNPTTLPSHANILSGVTSLGHGVNGNSKSKFPSDVPTVATELKAQGWETGAFVGAFPLDSRFGLDRGFDVYDDAFGPAGPAGAPNERRAAEVVQAAASWIAGRTGRWFCWVHLWDPHAPYAAPEPFLSRFKDDPYAGEVAYVDAQLGVLFGALGARGLLDRTLIILTADHGESLGEHGEMTHSYFAYDSTLHVPLIMAGPGIPSRRVEGNVSHVDIAPTVDGLLGIPPRPGLQGRSLAGAMKTGKTEDRPVYFESMEPYLDKGCAPLRGFRRGRMKFMDSPIPELYDLASDPGETKNLAPGRDLGPYRAELDRLMKAQSAPRAGRDDGRVTDAATLARLRSLGYAAAPVARPKASYGPADDVKTVLPFQQRLERAVLLADSGWADEGLAELRALVRDKTDFTPAYVYLAQTLMGRGRADEAVQALENGVRENPDEYALLSVLGGLLISVHRDARAEEVLTKALSLVDFDPDAWNTLGGIRLRQGDEARALECFNRAVALDPSFAPAHLSIGTARLARYLRQSHDPADLAAAVESLRRAATLDPSLVPALRGWGTAAMLAGNLEEAVGALERAVAADPKDDRSIFNLGLAYLKTGDKAKALRSFEAYLELRKDALTPEERARVLDLISRCRIPDGGGP